jgi:hypothetical protein
MRLGGPQSRSERHGEVKILNPQRDSNSDPSVVQPVASRYTDCAIPAHIVVWYIGQCDLNKKRVGHGEIRYAYETSICKISMEYISVI